MNKEEIFNEISSCFKMSVDMNGMKKLEEYITNLQQQNQKYKEVIDKAIEYMKDFIFEPLLINEDRKLIMYNDNLRNFEKILKDVKKEK